MTDEAPGMTDPAGAKPPQTVTDDDLRRFAEAVGLTRAAPGRYSRIFLFELYCRILVPALPGDPAKIVAEVNALEGHGRTVGTKPAAQFERPPLQGLWKKHYLVGGLPSMAKNLLLGFGKKRRELLHVIKEHHSPATADLSPLEKSRNIADAVTNIYAERSRTGRLTGDWIVFAKHEGRNYYLCLARHDEPDADIFNRIKAGCVAEFPFLRAQLKLADDAA